jgi:hypothetical protein
LNPAVFRFCRCPGTLTKKHTKIKAIKKLFWERISTFEEKVTHRKEEIKKMEEEYGETITNFTPRHFGRYLLFKRKLRQEEEEIVWCRWVLDLLDRANESSEKSIEGKKEVSIKKEMSAKTRLPILLISSLVYFFNLPVALFAQLFFPFKPYFLLVT